jgi:hypothetical protein
LNGYLAEAGFTDWSTPLGWFREQAVHHFLASEFASFTTDKSRLVFLREAMGFDPPPEDKNLLEQSAPGSRRLGSKAALKKSVDQPKGSPPA